MTGYDHLKRPPNRRVMVTGPMNDRYAFKPHKKNYIAYIVLWILICILSIDFTIHMIKLATDEEEQKPGRDGKTNKGGTSFTYTKEDV